MLSLLLKTEEMKLVLDQQDETDKRQVALYGMKKDKEQETTPGQENQNSSPKSPGAGGTKTIAMKKSCLSCSGSLPFVKNAFKMACLAYEPSKIVF